MFLVALVVVANTACLISKDKNGFRKGEGVVFASTKSGSWDIWTMSLDGSEPKRLTDTKYVDERFPCWSSRNNEMFYSTNAGDIIRYQDGARLSTVPDTAAGIKTNPSISPDGKHLAYVTYVIRDANEDADIYVINLATGDNRKFVDLPGHQFNPSWSYDGKYLTFMSGEIRGAYNIWMVSADGSGLKRIVKSDYFDNQPSLSPDNKTVAFSSNRSGNSEIWIADIDTGELKQLTQSPGADEYPQWSPDGKRILFSSYRNGHFHIWETNADGSNQRQLTHGQFDARDGNWVLK